MRAGIKGSCARPKAIVTGGDSRRSAEEYITKRAIGIDNEP